MDIASGGTGSSDLNDVITSLSLQWSHSHFLFFCPYVSSLNVVGKRLSGFRDLHIPMSQGTAFRQRKIFSFLWSMYKISQKESD